MDRSLFDRQRDTLLLLGRLLLVAMFVVFGWEKLLGFAGTTAYMSSLGLPAPALATVVAIGMELVGGLIIAVGIWTRPVAFLLALYTLAAALIGHAFWKLTGEARLENAINFYKNVSMMGGFLLLCAAGPGKYSIDRG